MHKPPPYFYPLGLHVCILVLPCVGGARPGQLPRRCRQLPPPQRAQVHTEGIFVVQDEQLIAEDEAASQQDLPSDPSQGKALHFAAPLFHKVDVFIGC